MAVNDAILKRRCNYEPCGTAVIGEPINTIYFWIPIVILLNFLKFDVSNALPNVVVVVSDGSSVRKLDLKKYLLFEGEGVASYFLKLATKIAM